MHRISTINDLLDRYEAAIECAAEQVASGDTAERQDAAARVCELCRCAKYVYNCHHWYFSDQNQNFRGKFHSATYIDCVSSL